MVIYELTIWYFDELEFLRDQKIQLPAISSSDVEEYDNDDSDVNTNNFFYILSSNYLYLFLPPESTDYHRKRTAIWRI